MPVLRILLLPFSLLYKLATDARNHLYNIGSRKSFEFDRFVIGVGNLTVGGTGKTPFVELLIRSMKDKYRLAVLSRGYKRKTRGFRMADREDDAQSIGDEPFQYYHKFSDDISVAVGEDRAMAIPEILFRDESIETIILDDAYQHRSVRPNLNILLNDYNRPFYDDYVLPSGMLRESRKGARRADMVIVAKCPDDLGDSKMGEIEQNLRKYTRKDIPIFFTGVKYLNPMKLYGNQEFSGNVLAFSGIANPAPLLQYLQAQYKLLDFKKYPDHYSFTVKDLESIVADFDRLPGENKCLVTTEKDMVRLISMKEKAAFIRDYPVFYLPIELYFLRNEDFFANYMKEAVEKGMEKIRFN
jgi:tetraacyldisaccharide 4'-kinase